MASRADREMVHGLRTSDVNTLLVLTQDVLRKPLIRIHPSGLCDLMALSELDDLPRSLQRDLARWRDQMGRELRDLPVGEPLEELLDELGELPPGLVPASLRELLQGMAADERPRPPTSDAALERLILRLGATPPTKLVLPTLKPRVRVEKVDTPDSHKAPDERRAAPAGGAPRAAAAPRTPAAQRDQRRDQWIREDLLERLGAHGANGLKQSLLVAGAKHRAPYKDLAEEEVLAMLRKLERENRVRQSAGRWSLRGARL